MHDEYEEDETEHPEYDEKEYLHSHDREERDDARYREGKHEKYDRYDDRTEIEKDHRIVELHRDTDMTYCHTSREWETLDHSFAFEDDEVLRIGEAHIQKKWKYQICSHDIANREEVCCREETKKEYICSDDRERTKYCYHIMCFK